MKPIRLSIAQSICRYLPPLIAQSVRGWIYPRSVAYRDDYSFTVRATTGSLFQHTTNDYPGYPFVVHGYFTWRAWAIARAICRPGDTIVEVGANVGTETIGFSDIVGRSGRVLAFEPLPANLQVLHNNVALNQLENVEILPMAVGNVNRRLSFSVPEDSSTSSVGSLNPGKKYETKKEIEVNCVTLGSMVTSIGDARFIFMDAEGAELDIILGAEELLASSRPFLVLEASSMLLMNFGYTVDDLLQVLRERNYIAFHIERFGLAEVDSSNLLLHDNWFCLHAEHSGFELAVDRSIKRCGIMPMVKGLNPLIL